MEVVAAGKRPVKVEVEAVKAEVEAEVEAEAEAVKVDAEAASLQEVQKVQSRLPCMTLKMIKGIHTSL